MLKHSPHQGALGAGVARRSAKALALILALALGACSFVPDWANPVAWYDSAIGDGVPPPPQSAAAPPPVPGATQPFPSLSSVPERPQAPTPPEQQQAMAQGLLGDRDQARYTSEALRGAPPPPPPAVTPALPPAPTLSLAPPAPTLSLAPPAPPPISGVVPVPPAPTLAAAAPPRATIPQPQIVAQPSPPPVISAPYPRLSPVPPAPSQAGAVAQLPWAPAPAPTQGFVPALRAATPFAARPAVVSDQSTLAQTFAASLAASAATVVTMPVHAGFVASTSEPLASGSVPVPEVVRMNYNEALGVISTGYGSVPGGVNGVGVQVASVKFAIGSAALSGAARRSIKGAARQHKSRGGRVVIIGHASERTKNLPIATHKLVNFKVSADRAQAVANLLMRNGVQAKAIVIEARGANDPLYYEWMPEGEAENRRTDIYLRY